VIGGLTGLLVAKEHAQRLRAEQSAEQLGDSYDQLRQQADMILEIEDQLRQADRLTALGELSAGLAHEIRNPLASIRGTAEILKDAFPPEDRYSEFTTILISEVDRLNQVLEEFLRFARPSASFHTHFSPCKVLREVVKLTAVKARKNTVNILCPDSPLPVVVGDSAQFKQVFLNLILNALQAMPHGGELHIEAKQMQQRVFLTFCDSGPGIAPAELDQVFQSFYTTKQDGTGLGLAISQRIVQNSGGHISVSCPETGGCCFTLDLAIAEEVPASEEHHE
jgi:signal transduction histidine kinase